MKSKIPQYYQSSPFTEENAIILRKNETSAEYVFWQIVRNRKLLNLKIRRQHPTGRFIADFYCHEIKLVIEIDGDIHLLNEVKERDTKRQLFLEGLGLTTLRFSNVDVFRNKQLIERKIKEIATAFQPNDKNLI